MKFLNFLKEVFVSRFWIKLISIVLAVFITFLLN